jgi:3-hydroxybutyryl-CoA dehydrogenase
MDIDQIKTICVVGAGNMGHQIAINSAIHGFDTWCTDVSQAALDKALAFSKEYLPGRVTKGRLTQEQADAAAAKLHFTQDLRTAAGNAGFVIEAAVERLQVKRELFTRLDEYAPPHAILATNSSFIVSSKVADATKRPDKVCNMHFFNPALVMKVVEVVRGPHTSEETANITFGLCQRMGKTPVMINKEIYGFVVNRILGALNHEAFFLAENGYASFSDIDIAVEGALNHPMGPFRLMDLTGIDLSYDIGNERFAETGDPADKPSPLVVERYQAGDYGRKTGKGFYNYK